MLDALEWDKNPNGVRLSLPIQQDLGPKLDELLAAGRTEAELVTFLAGRVRKVREQNGAARYLTTALRELPAMVKRQVTLAVVTDGGQATVRSECRNTSCCAPLKVAVDVNGDPVPMLCRDCQESELEPAPQSIKAANA